MMKVNLNKTNGLYNSQRVMLKLIQKNLSREKAYKIVQGIALKSWKEEKSFKMLLKKNKDIKSKLTSIEIDKLFELNHFFKNINTIYKRVLG